MRKAPANKNKKYELCFVSVESGGSDLQGPVFIHEPPHRVEFSNSNGGKVDCTAHGSPPPEVEWILGDGTTVYQVGQVNRKKY